MIKSINCWIHGVCVCVMLGIFNTTHRLLYTFNDFISEDISNKQILEHTADYYKVVPDCETVLTSFMCYKYKCTYIKIHESNISNICASDNPFTLTKYFKVLQYQNGISSEVKYIQTSMGNTYTKKYNGTTEKTYHIENNILILYVPEKYSDHDFEKLVIEEDGTVETFSNYISRLRVRYNDLGYAVTFMYQIIHAIQTILMVFPLYIVSYYVGLLSFDLVITYM